jgi:hypothetical protein
MNAIDPVRLSYNDFVRNVRRFSQLDLLRRVAKTAAALPIDATPSSANYRQTPPWALAAIVNVSICRGNKFRHTLTTDKHISRLCNIYNNLGSDELNHPIIGQPLNLLVRTAYEQFPYQQTGYHELARASAFFDLYSGRKKLEVIGANTIEQLLGATPKTSAGVAMLLFVSTIKNEGIFNPGWMQQGSFTEILEVISSDQILSVLKSSFSVDFSEFKAMASNSVEIPLLERYMFNPLTSKPLVLLDDGLYISPVPQLILNKLSPLELYYQGLRQFGEPFTRDMGELLEDYTGRQLREIPDSVTLPEIIYQQGKKQLKSVDWIVIFDNLVLLVEAKATRARLAARAGSEALEENIRKTLGHAFDQIDRTREAIMANVAEFTRVPKDRPFIGIVATLDPWYLANSPWMRELLPSVHTPTIVASIREIEHLVGFGKNESVSLLLRQLMDPSDYRHGWDLGGAITRTQKAEPTNTLLDKVWESYPFSG